RVLADDRIVLFQREPAFAHLVVEAEDVPAVADQDGGADGPFVQGVDHRFVNARERVAGEPAQVAAEVARLAVVGPGARRGAEGRVRGEGAPEGVEPRARARGVGGGGDHPGEDVRGADLVVAFAGDA